MAEPNPTVIRGGLLALVSAHPRTSLAAAALLRAALLTIWRSAERPPALLRAALLMIWRSAERPPALLRAALLTIWRSAAPRFPWPSRAGVVLALSIAGWL